MTKYKWSGAIDRETIIRVVACNESMEGLPNDLLINRKDLTCVITASQDFIVALVLDNKWVASLSAHQVNGGTFNNMT